jgi:hypothetical protein
MSKKAFAAPLTAQQCELIREFLGGGFEPVLLLMTAGEGQKARAEADKRNAGPDVLGLVAEIQVAGLPEGLRQAWLLGYRLKDEQRPPPPGCS